MLLIFNIMSNIKTYGSEKNYKFLVNSINYDAPGKNMKTQNSKFILKFECTFI
jgi:hypothetical protein